VKVVAIQGSPHRGNTHDRVERFARALTDLGDVEFEHVALKDIDLVTSASTPSVWRSAEGSD